MRVRGQDPTDEPTSVLWLASAVGRVETHVSLTTSIQDEELVDERPASEQQ
jgi:hypothetical protein